MTTEMSNDGNEVKEILPIANIELVRYTCSREEKILSVILKGDIKRTYWYSCSNEGEGVYQMLLTALAETLST